MKVHLHYCSSLKALTVRLHGRHRSFGADLYLTGLSLYRWKGGTEVFAWDVGRVGG